MKLSVEQLETRDTPTAPVFIQSGGTLTVYGDPALPNSIIADQVGSQVRVIANANAQYFSGVNNLIIVGGASNDLINNNSNINCALFGLAGNDVLQGGFGDNQINPGSGNDVVYALFGNSRIYANDDNESDLVISAPASFPTVFSTPLDKVVNGHTPGIAPATATFGVLDLVAGDNGSVFFVYEQNNKIFVICNTNNSDGFNTFVFDKINVQYIAFFGGNGKDTFFNGTTIPTAVYGTGSGDIVLP